LCTSFNIVVTPHKESKIILLTIRDLETLKELERDKSIEISNILKVPIVKAFDMKLDINLILETFKDMNAFEEGYVVVDKDFNRVKIKNPKYVSLHHLKGSLAEWRIITLVKSNEVDEFISSFPEREQEIRDLEHKYNSFLMVLEKLYFEIKIWKHQSE